MTEAKLVVGAFDPALAEATRKGAGDDELAVIARLSGSESLPNGVRVVTRFGDIATLRVPREHVARLAESGEVLDLEAPRMLRRSSGFIKGENDPQARAMDYARRPEGVSATGRGVVVGILDWGCDFAHPAFRNEDGTTRIRALWDQRDHESEDSGSQWGYGRILTRADIDRALLDSNPYYALNYHPVDEGSRDTGAHGTHVLDIAAGNGRGGGMVGVAPEADLVFVHLARTTDVLGRGNLGDSASVLEALDFVFSTAGDEPCVVNMSVGAHGGSHDGRTLVELGIDRAVSLENGRAVVNSAGNYFTANAHAEGRVRAGETKEIAFNVPPGDPTESELEIWYSGVDRFIVTVVDPSGTELGTVGLGQEHALGGDKGINGHIYHLRQPTNGENQIDLFLRPHASEGVWRLRIQGDRVEDGRYHAWIERDRGLRPTFLPADVVSRSTTGTLCNGKLSITVGAYDLEQERVARFSSSGPTVDGRAKPEILAPGVRIVAARSTPRTEASGARYTTKSGTSMAAPHVTGTVALMFEAADRPLAISDTRALLFGSASRNCGDDIQTPDNLHRIGNGILDTVAAERSVLEWVRSETSAADSGQDAGELASVPVVPLASERLMEEEETMVNETQWKQPRIDFSSSPVHDDSIQRAASILDVSEQYEHLLQRPVSSLGVESGTELLPIATPATVLMEPVQRGDLLVRSVPSPKRVHTAVVLSSPETAETLRSRGVPVENAGGGTYLEVMEMPIGGGTPRVVGRRLTDSWGRVPRGEAVLRPAAPVPSEQTAAQIDWCRMRQTIVANARAEEARWRGPTGTQLVESATSQLPFLVAYWMTVPGFTTAAAAGARATLSAGGTSPLGYWSAAFICFVMHASGIRAAHGFVFGGAHIHYIVGALRNRENSRRDRPFWLMDGIELRTEVIPEPGDLLCFNRPDENGVMSTHSYERLRNQYVLASPTAIPTGRSHCALVMGMVERGGQRFVQTIGGNEQNSVRSSAVVPVDAHGGILNASAHNIFGMIKIMRC